MAVSVPVCDAVRFNPASMCLSRVKGSVVLWPLESVPPLEHTICIKAQLHPLASSISTLAPWTLDLT